MYLDAMSFLEDERDAWRPFEQLADLADDRLERRTDAAHGWSGRDLMAHLVAWQEIALQVAKELAVGETSRTAAETDADWDARGGDTVNRELQERWAAVPLDELRARYRTVAGELRGYLTVVPETRWIKHPTNMSSILESTLDHYAEHEADLAAILDAGARS